MRVRVECASRLVGVSCEIPPPHVLRFFMDTISISSIINAILGFTRDILTYFAPLIGLLGGLKFLADWVHKLIFSKKV